MINYKVYDNAIFHAQADFRQNSVYNKSSLQKSVYNESNYRNLSTTKADYRLKSAIKADCRLMFASKVDCMQADIYKRSQIKYYIHS